jgi:hypothetical protein
MKRKTKRCHQQLKTAIDQCPIFDLVITNSNNMEIDKLIEGADVLTFIKAQRIKWLGHIQRMDQGRPTSKLLDWKPMGTRPVGKLRQRWQEGVMEDLK